MLIKVKTHRCNLFLDPILLEHISSGILLLEQVRVLTFFFSKGTLRNPPRGWHSCPASFGAAVIQLL